MEWFSVLIGLAVGFVVFGGFGLLLGAALMRSAASRDSTDDPIKRFTAYVREHLKVGQGVAISLHIEKYEDHIRDDDDGDNGGGDSCDDGPSAPYVVEGDEWKYN